MSFSLRGCVLILLAFLSACGTAGEHSVFVPRDVAYGPYPAQTLTLCQPQGALHAATGVLLVHGGGWNSGDKRDLEETCRRYAGAGLVAATVNYRLADAAKRETWWPAQLSDLQLAMRYLRVHAAEFGIRQNHICARGGSAGGHLVVFLGAPAALVRDELARLYPDTSSAADCVVDNFGPVDMTDPAFNHDHYSALFSGRTLAQDPQAYQAASPLALISEHSAPMLVAQGYSDPVVPAAQSLKLMEALSAHKVPVVFIGYIGGHKDFGDDPVESEHIFEAELRWLLAH